MCLYCLPTLPASAGEKHMLQTAGEGVQCIKLPLMKSSVDIKSLLLDSLQIVTRA